MQSETNGEVIVSDDVYWQYINGNWVPTELQNQALNQGAIPHQNNTNSQIANPNLVIVPNQSSGNNKPVLIVVGIAVGIGVLIALSALLYVWASDLAEDTETEDSLVGTWTNPEDRLELKSNGDVTETTDTFETWYVRGDDIFFEDDTYYYKFKYLVTNDIIFLAQYDEDGELIEGDCIAYLYGTMGNDSSHFDNRMEEASQNGWAPDWC